MGNEEIGRVLESIAKQTWEIFIKDPVTHILAFVVMSLLGTVTIGILAPALAVGYIKMIKKAAAGESIATGDIFDGLANFGTSFITGLIIAFGISIGMVLLVLPGLLVLVITFFALHFIAYENASISESLSGSLAMFKKNPLLVGLVILGVVILNSIGGAIFVGVLLTGPLAVIASACAFQRMQQEAAPQLEAPQ